VVLDPEAESGRGFVDGNQPSWGSTPSTKLSGNRCVWRLIAGLSEPSMRPTTNFCIRSNRNKTALCHPRRRSASRLSSWTSKPIRTDAHFRRRLWARISPPRIHRLPQMQARPIGAGTAAVLAAGGGNPAGARRAATGQRREAPAASLSPWLRQSVRRRRSAAVTFPVVPPTPRGLALWDGHASRRRGTSRKARRATSARRAGRMPGTPLHLSPAER
jgi:hypothetical protein